MNKINPLILTSVLVLVLLIMAYNISHSKDEIKENNTAILALDNNAKKIMYSKKVWDKTNLEGKLKAVFGADTLSDKGKVFEIKLSLLTHEQVDDIAKKAFNEAFEIEKFEIAIDSNGRSSVVLEITK
ncbi:MAG: hypothetical protein LBH45_06105 [Campylobacteraceae bacterium]|jgi:hypothetical protein|nr:hypothetical protein [Campylobacteraceae bacterium]